MKPALNVLATVLLLCACYSAGRSEEPSVATITNLKKSVVPIECIQSTRRVVNGNAGTAFFINREGYFITANHVIESVKSLANTCEAAVLLPETIQEPHDKPMTARPVYWFDLSSCAQDANSDIAVCRTIENPFSVESVKTTIAPVMFEARPQADGAEVAFTGFPNGYAWPVTARASIAASTPVNSLPTITIDRSAWHGMSGAPLYKASGGVIGLVLGGETGDNVDLCIARPTSVIMDFLREHGITYYKV